MTHTLVPTPLPGSRAGAWDPGFLWALELHKSVCVAGASTRAWLSSELRGRIPKVPACVCGFPGSQSGLHLQPGKGRKKCVTAAWRRGPQSPGGSLVVPGVTAGKQGPGEGPGGGLPLTPSLYQGRPAPPYRQADAASLIWHYALAVFSPFQVLPSSQVLSKSPSCPWDTEVRLALVHSQL